MVDPLPVPALRWRCEASELPFETTAEVEPVAGVIGQGSALEALRFGIESDAPGQNVFVRGLVGTGRMTMVRRLLDELMPVCQLKNDRCYVHNFSSPDRPRLITLEPRQGRAFRRRVREIADFAREDLGEALNSEAVQARRESLEKRARASMEAVTRPLQQDLEAAKLTMVQRQQGPTVQTALFPTVDGKAVPPEELAALQAEGKVTDADLAAWKASQQSFAKRLGDVSREVERLRIEASRAIASVLEDTAREILGGMVAGVREEFPGEDVSTFLNELVEDVIDRLGRQKDEDPARYYGVNLLMEQPGEEGCPIVVENTPTLGNLLGTIDREWSPRGPMPSDYSQIRAGALLRADGGYLILDARDVLTEAGAWKVLMRTLRTGRLEIVPPEATIPWAQPAIKPEPIPISLRVILVGDAGTYYLLDQNDPDFGHLFKVLADFDTEIEREPEGVQQYAGVLARIASEEGLTPFDRTAVAALAEHGARIASRRGRLTARFARIGDIAREASFLAKKRGAETVGGDDVRETVRRTKSRADLPSRRFQRLLSDGTIFVQTSGAVVGQINGLAVIQAGLLTYGFPARITATIGPGHAGVINVEGRASLSGQIHTKGFHILGGLLRHLLATDHALAFSASVAFEQSYGGIDGDSASGAEMCCLLSALTDVPIRQTLSITGAIDQHGHLQAIGGVNEKIEGFFDTCAATGLTGDQGVIIPRSNAGDLMLREDVVEACAAGKFAVYAVRTIHEALELLTGVPAGELNEEGEYPEDSLLHIAQVRAFEYWERSLLSPTAFATGVEDEDGEDELDDEEEGEEEEE
ncbi:MAG: AAA family ATPase [Planctomycetota bacterium]